jgi:hypothetical protein
MVLFMEYRTLQKGEIVRDGDETDRCVDAWRDDAKWEPVKESEVGTIAPDPQYPSHPLFRRRALSFEFLKDEGAWEAFSQVHDQMDSFRWIIRVCVDGKFDVNESDTKLCNGVAAFDTLAAAKAFCQQTEEELVHSFAK